MRYVIGVRHGEVHNPGKVIYAGLPGFGLSDAGRAQATATADALAGLGVPVVAVYASPLDRAMQTAEIVARAVGAEIVPDVRLHEWRHWSQWAGLTWEQLQERAAEEWNAYQSDPGQVTSGESLAELADRVGSWLADVTAAHEDGVVVGVSHLEPLRAILLRLLERPPQDLFSIDIGLGAAVRIQPDPHPLTADPRELVGR